MLDDGLPVGTLPLLMFWSQVGLTGRPNLAGRADSSSPCSSYSPPCLGNSPPRPATALCPHVPCCGLVVNLH